MDNNTLLQIKDHMLRIVSLIDMELSGDPTKCLHKDDVVDLTTMGKGPAVKLCNDCGHSWTEEVDFNGLQKLEFELEKRKG